LGWVPAGVIGIVVGMLWSLIADWRSRFVDICCRALSAQATSARRIPSTINFNFVGVIRVQSLRPMAQRTISRPLIVVLFYSSVLGAALVFLLAIAILSNSNAVPISRLLMRREVSWRRIVLKKNNCGRNLVNLVP